MAKNFKQKCLGEAHVRSEEAANKIIAEMGLAELREAMDLTPAKRGMPRSPKTRHRH